MIKINMNLLFLKKINQLVKNYISDQKFAEILKGSILSLFARIFASVFGLISSFIIVKWYGANTMGVVSIIISLLTLTSILTVFGTDTSSLRLIPEHSIQYSSLSAYKIYHKIQFIIIFFSIFIGTLLYLNANHISSRIFNKPYISTYISIATFFLFFKTQTVLNTSALRGLKLINYFAIMQILPQTLNLIMIVLCLILTKSADGPIYSYLISILIAGTFGWIVVEKTFRKRSNTSDNIKNLSYKDVVSISFPMLLTATMAFFVNQTGILMLGILSSDTEVGQYTIALKLSTLSTFMLTAVNSMAAPKFSELYYSGQIDELFRIAQKSTKLIFWTTIPILVLFAAVGKPIFNYFFGGSFDSSYRALVILLIGQFISSISGSTGYFMNMTGHQKLFQKIMFISASLNIILCYFLIPVYNINGAAFSGMLSTIFWNIAILFYIQRKFKNSISYIPGFDLLLKINYKRDKCKIK